jgi:S1-C subfamily serine protease
VTPSIVTHLLQVDGLFVGGDSGGPLVAADGTVVGLVEARATQAPGIGFAVSVLAARPAFARWQARPQPLQVTGDCAAPVGPPEAVAQVSDVSGSPDGPGVQAVLGRFATALNAGRYAEAFALFSPAAQRRTTLPDWAAQERSSRLFDIVVHQVLPATPAGSAAARPSATPAGNEGREVLAEVSFTSVQDTALGTNGQVCSLWQLTYLLVWSGGGWRIDRATAQQGSPQAC